MNRLPNLRNLSADQLKEAFANAGYIDTDVRLPWFVKMNGATYVYRFSYENDESVLETGHAYVSINEAGDIVAEF